MNASSIFLHKNMHAAQSSQCGLVVDALHATSDVGPNMCIYTVWKM